MNRDILLNCLENTGVLNETSVIGLYSFSSGLSGACFNQLYSSGDNYYNNLPYDEAYPLIYLGSGNQTSGVFSSNNPYYIKKFYSGNFGALISMNHSGCLNSGNYNYILFSSTSGLKNGNSGVVLGITPSNRLFFSANNYYSTISKEISTSDFAFISVEQNRFVNFGLFNFKDYSFYKKVYDHGSDNLTIEKLYFGGALSYDSYSTGYSGKLNEIYLFSGNLPDLSLAHCIDCIYATGYKYNSFSIPYTGIRITGSYWSGIKEIQVTGSEKVIESFVKTDGSIGYFYYESGKKGEVEIYKSLFPQYDFISSFSNRSGIEFSFDTGKKFNQTSFNAFFDLGLSSGDVVEVYTYPEFNPNLNLEIVNNKFPISEKEAQLFGNGLAETNGVDYSIDFNRQISGFGEDDILLYDLLTGSSVTIPFLTGSVIYTGSATSQSLIDIINIEGIEFFNKYTPEELSQENGENLQKFNWDIYINGQKLIESVNYKVTGIYNSEENNYNNHLYISGNNVLNFNNLNDPSEFKLVPIQKNPIKNTYLISGDSFYITGLNGFSEQVWKNGIRQKREIDYFKENTCSSQTDHYIEPNYSFELMNSNNDFVEGFKKTGSLFHKNYLEYRITKDFNYLINGLPSLSDDKVNSNQMFSYFKRSGTNKSFERNENFFMSHFKNQLSCINVGCDDTSYEGSSSIFLNDLIQSGIFSKTCIALTKRHVILPNNIYNLYRNHQIYTSLSISNITPQIRTGENIYFLTTGNQIISRKLLTGIFNNETGENTNVFLTKNLFAVGILDYDLPDDIEPCYLLPSGYKDYLTNFPNDDFIYPESFPCFFLDNFRCIYTQYLYSIGKNRLKFLFEDNQRKASSNLMRHSNYIDAGCPFFTIIDNKFVLLSLSNIKGTFDQGPNIAEFSTFIENSISVLNSKINLNGNYPLKKVELNFIKKDYAPRKLNYLHDYIDNTMLSFLDNYTETNNPVSIYDELPNTVNDLNPIIRNTGHIANSLNEQLTCWSPWQNYDLENPSRRHPTLITPRHVYFAGHYAIPDRPHGYLNGEPLPENLQYYVKFVDKNNVQYSGKIIARFDTEYVNYPSEKRAGELYGYDTQIALLDRDMPPEIKPCYFLPEPEIYKKYFFIGKKVNFIYPSFLFLLMNQYQMYSFTECVGIYNTTPPIITTPVFDTRVLSSSHATRAGDSGSPAFFIINGKLVFVLPSLDIKISTLNKIIKELNSKNNITMDYEVQRIDLSNFDKIEDRFSILETLQTENSYCFNSPIFNGVSYAEYPSYFPYKSMSFKINFINNKFIFNKNF